MTGLNQEWGPSECDHPGCIPIKSLLSTFLSCFLEQSSNARMDSGTKKGNILTLGLGLMPAFLNNVDTWVSCWTYISYSSKPHFEENLSYPEEE